LRRRHAEYYATSRQPDEEAVRDRLPAVPTAFRPRASRC